MKIEKKKLTPEKKMFYELKSKHPDTVLLFRCGDFYKAYEDDAKVCLKTIYGNDIEIIEFSFAYHALDIYLPKLVRAGHRVCICDQLTKQ